MLDWNLRNLLEDLKEGRISRRQFITTLTRTGIPIGVVATLLASCSSKGSDQPKETAPTDEGLPFEPKQRGGGGQLKLLWWQAPSILNGHMSNGTKDYDAASMFYEQLLYLDGDANFVQVVLALGAPGGFARRLHGGQDERDEHADDGDDDQQLHERKGPVRSGSA